MFLEFQTLRPLLKIVVHLTTVFAFSVAWTELLLSQKYLNADIIFGLTTDKVTKESVFMPNAGINHDILASGIITNETQQLRNHLLQLNKVDFDVTL